MFFKMILKNNRRDRKENGLLFVSLIVSIAAFYIILSLENQDVILFLKTMESDAVKRLLLLMPALYVVSLFLLFFLVYFAGKYQFEKRNHEFGMYLMLGLPRRKLCSMLIAEELWGSAISLAIGLPIAIFISELISIITAKVVGLGIIGHRFSISFWAITWTIAGYVLIRMTALLILSGGIFKKEITQLLVQSQDKKHLKRSNSVTMMKLLLGIVLLSAAYGTAMIGQAWTSLKSMGITVALGICGTFLFFHGAGILFEMLLYQKRRKNGLEIFTFRQLQEHVFFKSNALAVSSLLILMALCCFGYGISVSFHSSSKSHHVLHYTFQGEEAQIKSELKKLKLNGSMNEIFDIKIGKLRMTDKDSFVIADLTTAVNKQKSSSGREVLLNNLQYFDYPYMISLEGYNQILHLAGKEKLTLGENQAALYNGMEFSTSNTVDVLENVLQDSIKVTLAGEELELVHKLYQDNIVTDRSINLAYALIVPDTLLSRLADGENEEHYYNGVLKEEFVKKHGLMQAVMQVNEKLDKTDLRYESYMQNMGRQLFYSVAGSYTTIYLAIIFLIIANTVMGVQFLMQQQKTQRRCQTIIHLGCGFKELCKSTGTQIKWYFAFPITVAVISSIFGIRALFSGIGSAAIKADIDSLMLLTIPVILLLCVVECCYITAVIKMSRRHIHGLMEMRREDD